MLFRSEAECDCRKPRAGLGKKAIQFHGLEPESSFMVGDQMSDIEFARNIGLTPIGVRNEALRLLGTNYYSPDIVGVAALIP